MVFRTFGIKIKKKLKIRLQISHYHFHILLAWFYWRLLLEGDFDIFLGRPKFDQTFKLIRLLARI